MGAAGNPMYRFMCKLRFTEHELITWYKNSIGNMNNRLEEAKEEVEEVQNTLHAAPLDVALA
ncbi:hypothetical protein FRX31_013290, partial [Thalictrum thalictroides]